MAMTPEAIKTVYGWMPDEALLVYIDAYTESGNEDVAMAAVRSDARYEQWFPGNMTDDGRPRYDEGLYAAVTASYDDVFRQVGLSGRALDLMRQKYGVLIAGDVSPAELEEERAVPMFNRVISASNAIKERYATEHGIGLSDTELLASAMDPELGSQILEKQISLAEIGGEAAESGFDINTAFSERLLEAGMDRRQADDMFARAETFVPVLSVLAARHNDPDDDFNLEEFVAADMFKNPEEQRRIKRLLAQEQSTFTGGMSDMVRDRQGNVAGLGIT